MTPWGKLPLVFALRPKGRTGYIRNAVGNQSLGIQSAGVRERPSPTAVHPSWLRTQECLRAHNARRKAQGAALREAIRLINEAPDVGVLWWDAREVRSRLDLAALGRHKPPTLRTIQLHLKRTRAERRNAESNTSRRPAGAAKSG